LGYTIEEVLDHDVDWINGMLKEIGRQEMENIIFQMALHGADKEKIDKFRNEYESNLEGKEKELKDIRIPPSEFRKLGLGIGKKTHTRIIRDK